MLCLSKFCVQSRSKQLLFLTCFKCEAVQMSIKFKFNQNFLNAEH